MLLVNIVNYRVILIDSFKDNEYRVKEICKQYELLYDCNISLKIYRRCKSVYELWHKFGTGGLYEINMKLFKTSYVNDVIQMAEIMNIATKDEDDDDKDYHALIDEIRTHHN